MRKWLGAAGTAAVMAMMVPGTASAGLLWESDYSGGELAGWQGVQRVAPDRLEVVPLAPDASDKVMRAEVRPGDEVEDGGSRAEVFARRGDPSNYGPSGGWPDPEFSERWYGWQTYIPAGFPSWSDKFQLFVQWQRADHRGRAPLALNLNAGRVELRTRTGRLWYAPIRYGVWDSWQVRIKYARSALLGFVEVWRNGRQVLPRTAVSTMGSTPLGLPVPTYLKMGLYRNREIDVATALYHDEMRIGTDRASVVE